LAWPERLYNRISLQRGFGTSDASHYQLREQPPVGNCVLGFSKTKDFSGDCPEKHLNQASFVQGGLRRRFSPRLFAMHTSPV